MTTKLGTWIAVAASGAVVTAGVVVSTLQLASAASSSTGTAAASTTTPPGQVKKATPSPSPVVTITATPSAAPSSSAAGSPPAKNLTISPLTVSGLAPGVFKPASLLITNPNNQDVVLQSVVASIGGATPSPSGLRPCSSSDFSVTVTGYNPATGTGPTGTIPANSTAAVPVTVGMVNASDNQDNCKGKTYSLSFTATATSK